MAGAAIALVAALLPAAAASAQEFAPLPPRDLYLEAPRADQVVFTWRPGVSPPPGQPPPSERYDIFRDGSLVATTRETRFVDSWLEERRRYVYAVRAVDDQGQAAEAGPLAIETPAFGSGIELDPYLQQLTPTSAAVVWQTFEAATTSLHFGPAGAPLAKVERDARLTRGHVVKLTGLQPATSYQYRWESEGRVGPVRGFRTPPLSGSSFSFGVIGDFGAGTPAANANLRRLRRDAIDLAITTGDNAQGFGTEVEYRNHVLKPLHDFIATRPFWPSIGNHDVYNLQNYLRYFPLPNGGRYYSFSYGGVKFLSLDSNWISRSQKVWLRRELREPARCKVAFFHHPLWSSGRGYRGGVRKQRRRKLVPLLERGGVDLVLNGHVQNYERSRPLRGGRRSRRGIVYVVTGGGGARLNGFVTRRRPRWSARRGVFHHRLRVTASRHKLRANAIDTLGRTRDRFTVPCR